MRPQRRETKKRRNWKRKTNNDNDNSRNEIIKNKKRKREQDKNICLLHLLVVCAKTWPFWVSEAGLLPPGVLRSDGILNTPPFRGAPRRVVP